MEYRQAADQSFLKAEAARKSSEAEEGGSKISPETSAGTSQVEPSKYLHQFPVGY